MYLVGIDVGTTNTKTVIFDVETGHICAVGSCRSIARHPVAEWSEFDAEDLWETVLKSIKIAIQHCDRPERIRAISVSSMGESAFPLDADGKVLYAAIDAADVRLGIGCGRAGQPDAVQHAGRGFRRADYDREDAAAGL